MTYEWASSVEEVRYILREIYRLQPSDYEIDPATLLVSTNTSVECSFLQLTCFQIRFDRIAGLFDATNTKITTLEGCPKFVNGDFLISLNKNLHTFDFLPEYIGGSLFCMDNSIQNLLEFVKLLKIPVKYGCTVDPARLDSIFDNYHRSNKANSDKLVALEEIKKYAREKANGS